MIAALILSISLLTLLQFFVSYCRALIAESREHRLSDETREICGIESGDLAGEKFPRLSELIALCPESGGDSFQVRAVALYFRLLVLAHSFLSWAIPSTASWIDSERGGCACAAAMILDRRIAFNRTMMAQQANH
jgi:hypothetical protein